MKILASLACFAAAILPVAQLDARPFTPEDLVQFRRLAGSSVSPDGTHLVFALREPELAENRLRGDLWITDLTNGDAVPQRWLASLGADESRSAPAFSRDGERVYYLSTVSGSSQLWMADFSDPQPVQVTSEAADIAGFSLSPDGTRLALWFDEHPDCIATSCADPENPENSGTVRRYDEIFARQFGSWEDGTQSRLVTVPVADGLIAGEGVVVSRLIDGNTPGRPFGGSEEIAWHPTGNTLFFTLRENGPSEPTSTDLDIYEVAADGSSAPELLTGANPAVDNLPTPSPDGRFLAYVAMATPGYEADRQILHLRDLTTGETRALTAAWDRSIQGMAWSADMQYLWLLARDGLDSALYRYVLAEGSLRRFSGPGSVGSASPQADGTVLVTMSSALAPADIYRIDGDGNRTQITNVNGALFADIEMPEREVIRFRGADGHAVTGQVFRPPNLPENAQIPVTLWVHGGPQGSFGNNWSYRWNYAAMASQGYAVVTIDFHGSTGYGQAFTDSINNDWGGRPLEDLQLGLEAVLDTHDWMDRERVCAVGASYGGYMMNWIAGNWPDRFDCLANHAGIFDLRMFYYATEELFFPEHDFGGPYFERARAYERWNPANHVENWQTPMMVIHGERDFRIPYSQSLAAFTALQRRGIPSRLLVFPDENHWILRPRNSLQWHREVYDWIGRWTAEEPAE